MTRLWLLLGLSAAGLPGVRVVAARSPKHAYATDRDVAVTKFLFTPSGACGNQRERLMVDSTVTVQDVIFPRAPGAHR